MSTDTNSTGTTGPHPYATLMGTVVETLDPGTPAFTDWVDFVFSDGVECPSVSEADAEPHQTTITSVDVYAGGRAGGLAAVFTACDCGYFKRWYLRLDPEAWTAAMIATRDSAPTSTESGTDYSILHLAYNAMPS
jgi:hypothetical protein